MGSNNYTLLERQSSNTDDDEDIEQTVTLDERPRFPFTYYFGVTRKHGNYSLCNGTIDARAILARTQAYIVVDNFVWRTQLAEQAAQAPLF